MIPVRLWARDLYGKRLTPAQRAAMDAVLERPDKQERMIALCRTLGADPDYIPNIGDLTRSQFEAEALVITWVDSIVLESQEDYDLLAWVRDED